MLRRLAQHCADSDVLAAQQDLIEQLVALGEAHRDTWAAHRSRDLLGMVAMIESPKNRLLSAREFYDELHTVRQALAWITWIERTRIESDLFAASLTALGVFELSIFAHLNIEEWPRRHGMTDDQARCDLIQRDVFDAPRETRAGPRASVDSDCPRRTGPCPWEAQTSRPSFDLNPFRPPGNAQ
jgi:hypothetical protein